MRIDHSRRQRNVAKIDRARRSRMLNRLADLANALAIHEDFARLKNVAGVYLEQARGVQHDGSGGLLGGRCQSASRKRAHKE
jgi:hypothetical protein